MDIEDSQDFVVRCRKLVEDVKNLQAYVNNAKKNLLNLQVTQDANYWHLKEKYDQFNEARERLKQNMLQLQMQFEAASAECQQERRLGADIVNKLNSTGNLFDELERLVEQSKQAYAKTKADQQALYDAYLKADQVVQKLEKDHLTIKEQSEQRIRELEGKMTQMTAQLSQMSAVYSECQQRADAELSELRSQLREACVAERELAASTSKLGVMKAELEQREATISSLQRDMRYIVNNIYNQIAEAKNMMKRDNDLKSANEEIESLKRALRNQEQLTKTQCDHNTELQEKLALLEEERQKDIAANDAYKIKIEEMNSMCQTLNSDIAKLREENDNLTKELNDKQETFSLCDGELESFKQQLMQYDFKCDKVTLELNNTKEESQKHLKKILEVETAFANYREAAEEKLKQQATIIEDINKEQELKTSIINKEREERVKLEKELELITSQANIELQSTKNERDALVVELQNKTEIIEQMDEDLQLKNSAMLQNKEKYDKLAEELQKQAATVEEINTELEGKISALAQEKEERENLEAALRKMKRDWDNESKITKEKEKNLKERVSQLEAGIRAKDEEITREMTNFLQRRNQLEKEKCALQEVIIGLEQRINNIVKEVSKICRDTPEPDDNAIMRTPHRDPPAHSPTLQLRPQTPGSFQDTLLSHISEPSADSLGPQEPRCFSFASRSEALPPAPSPPKKRMRPDTPPVRAKTARANVAAADSFWATETKSEQYRFFRSRGNSKKK